MMSILKKACAMALSGALLIPQAAEAFDTGYHHDATMLAMDRMGYSQDSRMVAATANWLVDYYASFPGNSIKGAMEQLHFDNIASPQQARHAYATLLQNSLRELDRQATADHSDPAQYVATLAIIGMTLHAIQDFYTHSNWTSFYPAVGSGPIPTDTVLSRGDVPTTPAPTGDLLYSGRYPADPKCKNNCNINQHGDYFSGLNKDSAIRPGWEHAYILSYVESIRFLNLIEQRFGPNSDLFTVKHRGFEAFEQNENYGKLKQIRSDYAAARDISMFISAAGQDGHWKGNLSGDKGMMAAYQVAFSASSDSILVGLMRDSLLAVAMSNCVYDFEGCPTPAMPGPVRVEVTGNVVDLAITGLDIGGQFSTPDPFLEITFDEGLVFSQQRSRILVDHARYAAASKNGIAAFRGLHFLTENADNYQLELTLKDFIRTGDDDVYRLSPNADPLILFTDGTTFQSFGSKPEKRPFDPNGTAFQSAGQKRFGLSNVIAAVEGVLSQRALAPLSD